jgi:hypothetical protein
MKIAKCIVLLALVISRGFPVNPAHAVEMKRDSSSQQTLLPCIDKLDMDCIQSFTYSYPNKKELQVKLIQPASGYTIDALGQRVDNAQSTWIILDQSGQNRKITTVATLSGEKFISPTYSKFYPSLWFYIFDMQKIDIISGLNFHITFRTTWLKPENAAAYGANGEMIEGKYPGGHLYSFSAGPFLATGFSDPSKYGQLSDSETVLKSDQENPTLYFVIDHASSIRNGSMYDSSCSDFGYTFESDNGIAAGQPGMDSPNSLNFVMYAPHFLSTGEINSGFFSANIQKAYLDC